MLKLKLDEHNQLLVTNPFAGGGSTASPSNNDDILGVTPTLNSSFQQRPFCSRPIPKNVPSITAVGSEGEMRPTLTRPLSLDGSSFGVAGEDRTTGSVTKMSRSSGTIIHPVSPNDTFAGVALRYGISIAALRRANQLWPSDPIHLRTELFIPRGDVPRGRRKPTHGQRTDATMRSVVEPTPDTSFELVTSSFVAARDMILSVLPARISLDSLSSKASVSEDHELDDLQTARRRKMFPVEAPFAQDGHELSILAAPRAQYRLPDVALPLQYPRSPTDNQHLDPSHISSSTGKLHSLSISSSHTVSLERLSRRQPFAAPPVRTSQLEPEPVMELPVRRSRI